MAGFEPLAHSRRADNVAEKVRRAILDGSLRPGDPVTESQLAAEFGTSRAPVREAMRTLEEEGLVTKVPYRGAVVTEVGPEIIEEMASLRSRLEPFAVELALPALQREDFARLVEAAELLEKFVSRGDIPGSIDAHLALHRLFYELSGHKLLLDCWRSWEARLRLYLVIDHTSYTSTDTMIESHWRLVEVVRTGDVAAITAELQDHIGGSARTISAATGAEKPARRKRA